MQFFVTGGGQMRYRDSGVTSKLQGKAMSSSTDDGVPAADSGDPGAFQRLLELFRPRLKRCVSLRMDPRLSTRFDPSDVAQEAITQAWLHRDQFEGASRPMYSWLREIACNRLLDLQRRHLAAERRSVTREEAFPLVCAEDRSFDQLSQIMADSASSPSCHLERQEVLAQVRRAIDALRPMDREILVMRHLEQMSVEEIADSLQITRTNVSTRHLRALQRLQQVLIRPESP